MHISLAILFGLLFCAASSASAGPGSTTDLVLLQAVANSKSWKKVLHYRNDESLIDSGTYFFSSNGKSNPLTELIATLTSFSEAGVQKQAFGVDSRCAFPFRFKFLKQSFNLTEPVHCPELSDWLKDKDAEKTILVFASEYANNPASMMGHTFLRMQQKNQRIGNRHVSFLDTTFNFAAQIPEDVGSISYMVKGLTGGFDAVFSHDTFENQIERYNNMESRDIWEYELSLSEEQSRNLTLHIYELIKHARWEYFFFDENCSYHLLKAIEAISPDHNLTGTLNSWVIPIDTIKVLLASGLVESWTFRPSLNTRARQRYASLSQIQKDEFKKIINTKRADTQDVLVLDTAILYMNYLKHNKQGVIEDNATELTRDLLRKRAQSGITNAPAEQVAAPTPPQDKPSTFRYGFGFHYRESSSWLTADIRPAVHEHLSGIDPTGSNHEVVFLAPSVRYHLSEAYLDLERLVLISTANFRQTNPIGFSPAWRILADIDSVPEISLCRFCKSLRFLPAIGSALSAFDQNLQTTILATIHAEYGTIFDRNHRLGSGMLIQMIFHTKKAKLVAKVERWWDYRRTMMESADLKLIIPTIRDREIWVSAESSELKTQSYSIKYNIYR